MAFASDCFTVRTPPHVQRLDLAMNERSGELLSLKGHVVDGIVGQS